MEEKCPKCEGTGLKAQDELCPECEGYGIVGKAEIAKKLEEEVISAEEAKRLRELKSKIDEYFLEYFYKLNKSKVRVLDCCEDAKEYGNIRYSNGKFLDPQGYEVKEGWYLVYDDWTEYTYINFCPFCGMDLEGW